MEMGDNLRRQSRPTMLQLQYLMELERAERMRGVQGLIAARCGVNASTVNRYFKACIEKGYLDEEYEFTEKGRVWLAHYKKILIRLERYLRDVLGRESEVQEAVKNLVENTDCYILEAMLSHYERQNTILTGRRSRLSEDLRDTLQQCGRHEVRFGVYRLEQQGRQGRRFSMAMRGFRQEAYVLAEEDGEYLELTLQDMTASSRVDGHVMTGRLSSLRYERDGQLVEAREENQKIRIPLSACKIYRGNGGQLKGVVPITVTCSVGRTHMPESTALLVFWL